MISPLVQRYRTEATVISLDRLSRPDNVFLRVHAYLMVVFKIQNLFWIAQFIYQLLFRSVKCKLVKCRLLILCKRVVPAVVQKFLL